MLSHRRKYPSIKNWNGFSICPETRMTTSKGQRCGEAGGCSTPLALPLNSKSSPKTNPPLHSGWRSLFGTKRAKLSSVEPFLVCVVQHHLLRLFLLHAQRHRHHGLKQQLCQLQLLVGTIIYAASHTVTRDRHQRTSHQKLHSSKFHSCISIVLSTGRGPIIGASSMPSLATHSIDCPPSFSSPCARPTPRSEASQPSIHPSTPRLTTLGGHNYAFAVASRQNRHGREDGHHPPFCYMLPIPPTSPCHFANV